MDSILLSSPYALSFGGFVSLGTAAYYAAGGVLTSLINTFVWGWAIEWTFFFTEIAAAIVYY